MCQQQTARIAGTVVHDLSARRAGRVFGMANRPQRRAVQQRTIVEVEQEHRRVGRDALSSSMVGSRFSAN
jgi:hypothetical protein